MKKVGPYSSFDNIAKNLSRQGVEVLQQNKKTGIILAIIPNIRISCIFGPSHWTISHSPQISYKYWKLFNNEDTVQYFLWQTRRNDEKRLIGFNYNKKTRKINFACSLGYIELDSKQIKNLLDKFASII